jgi:hypothetical protein
LEHGLEVHIVYFQLRLELDKGDCGVDTELQLGLNHAQVSSKPPQPSVMELVLPGKNINN